MIARYRSAYAAAGTVSFSAAGFLTRLPIAIYPIALVLLISARTGAYGFAGVVSGCYVIGGALGNPFAGTLVDRFGQRRVLPPFLLAHVLATTVVAVLITEGAPLWTLPLPALLMGAALLNVGALIRARWSFVWAGADAQRSTAYSVESTLDEIIFVLGPLIATLLATHAHPLLTLGLAVAVVIVGTAWLARQVATEPPVRRREPGERRDAALRSRGMLLITSQMIFMGGVFGSAEVTMVAFCGQHGQRTSAGWVVACFAGGSAVAGLLYGARHWHTPLLRRYLISGVIFGVLPFVYLAASTPTNLALLTALVGLSIAPTLIGGFGLIDAIVPAASLTEGLTWIGTGLSVGFGIGASVAGRLADAQGAHDAFWLPICCGLAAATTAVLLVLRLRTPARAAVAVG